MKAKIHIPTYEYAFIEIEMDGEAEDIKSVHDNLRSITQDGYGHNIKEWARVRNGYVLNGELAIEDFEACNKSQKYVINEIKKSIK